MKDITQKIFTRSKVVVEKETPKTWIDSFKLMIKLGNMVNSVPMRYDGRVQVNVRAKSGM